MPPAGAAEEPTPSAGGPGLMPPAQTAGGVVLHHLAGRRDRAGAPVLVVHAAGLHAGVYRELAEHLAARPGVAGVFGLDLRCHGDSAKRPFADWGDFARDVHEAVGHLGWAGEVVGVGHSLGGASCMLCEAAHPGLFRALYCFEPPTPMGPHPHMLAASARRRQRAFPSREEALRRLAGKPPFNRGTRRALESYVREGLRRDAAQYVWKCDPGDEARVYLTGLKSNVAEAARRGRLDLQCPVVLAAGTAAPGHAEVSRAMDGLARLIPGCRLERYEGVEHFGIIEDPALVAERVHRAVAGPAGPGYLHFGASRL